MVKRVIIFVLDSLGIGELPDSEKFGDVGANTLKSIYNTGNLKIPNLEKLGLGHIEGIDYLNKTTPIASFGRSMEESVGKDTTTGHWEIAGLLIDKPFSTFPEGFPQDIIDEFERRINRGSIVNKPYSGTEVLVDYGDEHVSSGKVIVYTSADSVFQVAAHEKVVPLEELYRICQIARDMDIPVARVIARPFIGESGNYERTPNRHDYSIKPYSKTLLDYVKESGKLVKSVGKISDIFDGEGITHSNPTKSNMDGVDKTIELLKEDFEGLIFTNLVDFDAKFGHRRDPIGYKLALEEFDERLPEILENLKETDIIIFTADHGNDPSFSGTDHTREYIPILVYGDKVKAGINLGTRKTFSDIAKTVADILGIDGVKRGESFKNEILG